MSNNCTSESHNPVCVCVCVPCAATEVECVCVQQPSSMSPHKQPAARRSYWEQNSWSEYLRKTETREWKSEMYLHYFNTSICTTLLTVSQLTNWNFLSEGQRDEEEGQAHSHTGHHLVHGELGSDAAVSSLVRILQQKIAEHVLCSHVGDGHLGALLLPAAHK